MKDHFIYVNGIKARYWDEGQGAHTLVLVHGIAACIEFWGKNFDVLSKHARVIALDLIGFGATDKPNIDYPYDIFSTFLKNFLDALKINRCILVGHSMGGGVCLELAALYPQQVEQLVLVSSVGFDRSLPFSYCLVSLPIIGKLLLKPRSKKIMTAILRRFAYDKRSIPLDVIKSIHHYAQSKDAKRALFQTFYCNVGMLGIQKSILARVKERASSLTMPVTIIWGQNDKLLSVQGAYEAAQMISHARLFIFDKCGHMPQLEHSEEFNKLIIREVLSCDT